MAVNCLICQILQIIFRHTMVDILSHICATLPYMEGLVRLLTHRTQVCDDMQELT